MLNRMKKDAVYGALFGVAIGDALGVPVEFNGRATLLVRPITDFEGYKSHFQPPGTFSDDSSLTFCLAESLCNGYNLADIGAKFVQWRDQGYWTARGDVFDIGNSTASAISRLRKGTRPELAGDFFEDCNGNGSLMRILPLLFYIKDFGIEQRFEITKDVSSITHGHIRSVIACFYYLEFALQILQGKNKEDAYSATAKLVKEFLQKTEIIPDEIDQFASLLHQNIAEKEMNEIRSSGYVLDTLQAAIWCLMTTTNYKEAVIKAVNLGSDTDTTGAVTGGLAGLYYGFENIPKKWRKEILRRDDIADLSQRLFSATIQNTATT
jgi:ADP-ribosyl-[dinitrogen reductase] hydrolase